MLFRREDDIVVSLIVCRGRCMDVPSTSGDSLLWLILRHHDGDQVIESDGLNNIFGFDYVLLRCDIYFVPLQFPPVTLTKRPKQRARKATKHFRNNVSLDHLICTLDDMGGKLSDSRFESLDFDICVLLFVFSSIRTHGAFQDVGFLSKVLLNIVHKYRPRPHLLTLVSYFTSLSIQSQQHRSVTQSKH